MRLTKNDVGILQEDQLDIIEDVRESGCFGRSKRQLRLFEHLLEKSRTGLTSEVTQYSIALDVLDRPESFDPGTDSIVRVEMHRLRSSVQAYNATNAKYHISVPPAGFRVHVRLRRQRHRLFWLRLSILTALTLCISMALFSTWMAIDLSGDKEKAVFVENGCSEILPNILVRNVGTPSEIQVYVDEVFRSALAQQTSFNLTRQGQDLDCFKSAAPVFNVNYTVVERSERISVSIAIITSETKDVIGSYHLSGAVADTREGASLYYDIVKTANAIAMPDSTMARVALKMTWPKESHRENYRCLPLMYDSFSGGTSKEVDSVHDCLKMSIGQERAPYDNYGGLAASYLELARTTPSPMKSDAFNSAEAIIFENTDSWVNSVELTIAGFYYEAQREDFNAERFRSVLLRAEIMYSTNPQILIMASFFYGYSLGDWEKANEMSKRIKSLHSVNDQSTYVVDAGYALMNFKDVSLMDNCAKFYAENSVYSNVVVNACARKAKDSYWLDVTESNLTRSNVFSVSQKMAVFNATRHDAKFLSVIRNFLTQDPAI